MDETPAKLTIDDIVRVARVSDKSVRRAIHAGTLPATKVLGRYRFDQADVEKWSGVRINPSPDSDPAGDAVVALAAALECTLRGDA